MNYFVEWSPVAAFLGTVLTTIPVVRAALYLRRRTKEPAPPNEDDSVGPGFSALKTAINRRLEFWAQHWPAWLMWSLMVGLTLVIYASGISAAQALGWIAG